MELRAEAVEGFPRVDGDTELAHVVANAVDEPDVVCVASTVVSKAEDRVRALDSYSPSRRAHDLAEDLGDREHSSDPRFVEAVLQESVELLIEQPFLLAETDFGHVAPNAGVDRSNVEGEETVLLLPTDPMGSARELQEELGCPVVVTDTCGRPFRRGQTGVAVGWSGLPALRDWRGTEDIHGHTLEATEQAVVDEFAATANHLMGEAAKGAPVVEIEGVDVSYPGDDRLHRPDSEDLVKEALRLWRDS